MATSVVIFATMSDFGDGILGALFTGSSCCLCRLFTFRFGDTKQIREYVKKEMHRLRQQEAFYHTAEFISQKTTFFFGQLENTADCQAIRTDDLVSVM